MCCWREMMADRMFKAKLELRFFHVRLPLETESEIHVDFGRVGRVTATSCWNKQNFIAVLDVSWPHILWGTFFPPVLQIPHSIPLCVFPWTVILSSYGVTLLFLMLAQRFWSRTLPFSVLSLLGFWSTHTASVTNLVFRLSSLLSSRAV